MYSYKDVDQRREWIAYLQAGAGIVADSVPDDEHQECQNKAAGLARAIDLAEAAFVDKWIEISHEYSQSHIHKVKLLIVYTSQMDLQV